MADLKKIVTQKKAVAGTPIRDSVAEAIKFKKIQQRFRSSTNRYFQISWHPERLSSFHPYQWMKKFCQKLLALITTKKECFVC